MTVNLNVLVPPKIVDSVTELQFTAKYPTIIDKFTVANFDVLLPSITVYLVSAGTASGNTNTIVKSRLIQPGETYSFPEIIGHYLLPGDAIWTKASNNTSLSLRVSGREIS